MAMNFPSSPTVGALYQAPGGPTFKWDGNLWVPQVGVGAYLEKGSNLSDVTDKQQSMQNLGMLWRPSERFAPVATSQVIVAAPVGSRHLRIKGQYFVTGAAESYIQMRVPNSTNDAYIATATYTYQRVYNETNTLLSTDRISAALAFQVSSVVNGVGWQLEFEINIAIGANGNILFKSHTAGYRPSTDSYMQGFYTGAYAIGASPSSFLLIAAGSPFGTGSHITTEYAV